MSDSGPSPKQANYDYLTNEVPPRVRRSIVLQVIQAWIHSSLKILVRTISERSICKEAETRL